MTDSPMEPETGHSSSAPGLDHLLSRTVRTETGCWIWTGARQSRGYGSTWRDGRTQLAHRVSWELHRSDIEPGLTIDHLCGNKLCVNPDHLEPVTAAENVGRFHARRTHCKAGHVLQRRTRGSGTARFCPTCERFQRYLPAPDDPPLFELG